MAIRTEYNLRLKSGAAAIAPVTLPPTQRPRQELDDVTLRYLQDLLAWVEENQRRISTAEWGVDLPTVDSQLGSHRGLHQSIEEFRAKIERARADEVSLASELWLARLWPWQALPCQPSLLYHPKAKEWQGWHGHLSCAGLALVQFADGCWGGGSSRGTGHSLSFLSLSVCV